MKKFLRPLLLGLILSVGVSLLTGCGKKADYAIRVGDLKISENDYYRNVLALRSNYLGIAQRRRFRSALDGADGRWGNHVGCFCSIISIIT